MKTLMAIVFAIAGAFGAVAAKGAAQTLAAAAIGFAPLVLTIRGRMAAQAQSAQLLAAAREAVGVSADAKFAHGGRNGHRAQSENPAHGFVRWRRVEGLRL